MFKKFSPTAVLCIVIIVLFVIASILSIAVPSMMNMTDKLRERSAAVEEALGEVPLHQSYINQSDQGVNQGVNH